MTWAARLCPQVDGNIMMVMDSYALPVEGTETRVNAQAQAYEYMATYMERAKQVGASLRPARAVYSACV